MTIPFNKLKARLLANPKVKAEYDALAPEFEISAELVKARLRAGLSGRIGRPHGHQPVHHCPARERSGVAEHEDALAFCRGDRQQVPRSPVCGLKRRFSMGAKAPR